jgi:hypothetical protein
MQQVTSHSEAGTAHEENVQSVGTGGTFIAPKNSRYLRGYDYDMGGL